MTDGWRRRGTRSTAATLVALGLAAAACGSPTPSGSAPSDSAAASGSVAAGQSAGVAEMIPQPSVGDLEVAEEAARIDLAMPTFSDPTAITNPLFPVSHGSSNVLVGEVDGEPFRTEVTVLPTTRVVDWGGQPIETLVSQYVAFLGGRIHEVAYDLYAQADDGSVWYFGEDVFNFADGAIVDTHGTWHAGADGPAAMIMPGEPSVGDVYRPENIPGLVFEEVTVKSTGETVDGPFGPIDGAIVVEELHMDGATEEKQFAPAYGEFYTADGQDIEALALSLPTDEASGSAPAALDDLEEAALEIVDAVRDGDLDAAREALVAAQDAHAQLPDDLVPALLDPLISDGLDEAASAIESEDTDGATAAAIGMARIAGDLRLRYVPAPDVDLSRLGLWADQLSADASEEDADAVRGDTFSLTYTRERVASSLSGEVRDELNAWLEELQGAVADEDFPTVVEVADEVSRLTREVQPQG